MVQKRAVTKEMAKRYRKASKKAKGNMLDELCALTGWSRDHARRALREAARPPQHAPQRVLARTQTYGDDLIKPLPKIWATLDGPCGKRLAPFLPEIVPLMERVGELELTGLQREQLLGMSAATIDRRLAPERRRLRLNGKARTKPGTLLKHQVQIRTFAEWDEARPGFIECDLVAHEGGNAKGDYCQTLDLTDIATGWTEMRAVKNKAQRWVFEALVDIEQVLPFPLAGIDSDNGAEFINDHLIRYCSQHKITFTRSRPYRKNDGCFVEQKNWSVVRQNVGYLRYDSDVELNMLNELYGYLRLYVNFFQPQMKLAEKTRTGARVYKRYDHARTPYQRLLDFNIPTKARKALRAQYLELNPVQLKRDIAHRQDQLLEIAKRKDKSKGKEVKAPAVSRTSGLRQRSTRSRAS